MSCLWRICGDPAGVRRLKTRKVLEKLASPTELGATRLLNDLPLQTEITALLKLKSFFGDLQTEKTRATRGPPDRAVPPVVEDGPKAKRPFHLEPELDIAEPLPYRTTAPDNCRYDSLAASGQLPA